MSTVLAAAVLVAALLVPGARVDAAERGEVLFDLCAQCHGPDGGGNQLFLAPSIAGMDEWYVKVQLDKFRGGTRGTHFDDISGMRMRPMSLTLANDADVAAVSKYVASLPPRHPEPVLEGGDPAKGAAAYAVCGTCHGTKGEGMQQLNGPPLSNLNDWYMLSQLQKFKVGVRGADPRDPIAIMMRPMAMTLADDQAMLDVIAYITTLAE